MKEVRLVREQEVLHRLGIGKTTLSRWCASGEFPSPVRLGARMKAWDSRVVESFINGVLADSQVVGLDCGNESSRRGYGRKKS